MDTATPTIAPPHQFEVIGPLQARVMHYIWSVGTPVTVTEVHDAVNKTGERPLAYTTFLTVMRNLARRGILSQTKTTARSHLFRALITRTKYEDQVVQYLVDTIFTTDAYLKKAIERRHPESQA